MQQTVLVVEDEMMIREALKSYLEKQGWQVFDAEYGKAALQLFRKEKIDFVILDLMLPDITGEEICQTLRQESAVPIIMLTAKAQEEALLNGLNIGADDYLTKPFSLKELYARMEAIMRRVSLKREIKNIWTDHYLTVDLDKPEIYKQGELFSLTLSEWKILTALIRYPQKVFTRNELIEIAFSSERDSFDRVIDTHIKNLRKKIEKDPRNPTYIKTVYGLGYRFGGKNETLQSF